MSEQLDKELKRLENEDQFSRDPNVRLSSLRGIIYDLANEDGDWAGLSNILRFWPKESWQIAAETIIESFKGNDELAREIPDDIIRVCKGNSIGIVLQHVRNEALNSQVAEERRPTAVGTIRGCIAMTLQVGVLSCIGVVCVVGGEYLDSSDDCRVTKSGFTVSDVDTLSSDPEGLNLSCRVEPPILPFFDSKLACADPDKGHVYVEFYGAEIERTYGLRAPVDQFIGKDLSCDVIDIDWSLSEAIRCGVVSK